MLLKSSSCCFPQFQSEFFFINRHILSVLSESLGKNFARYWTAPRNNFNCFLFSGCLKSMIAFTFSLFGLIPFRVPFILFCLERIQISFGLPGIPHHLASSEYRLISYRDPPGFLGLRQLCHLTRPVLIISMFGQFSLGR